MANIIDATLRLVDKFTLPMNDAIKAMENSSKKAIDLGNDIQKAGKKLSDVGSSLSKGITNPMIAAGLESLNLKNSMEEMAAKVGNGITFVGDLSSGVGGAVTKFGDFSKTVKNSAGAFDKLGKIGKIGNTFKKFGDIGKAAFMVVSNPAFIVVAVISAIALAAFLIIKNWNKVKAFFSKLGTFIKTTFVKAGGDVSIFGKVFNKAKDIIARVVLGIKKVISSIVTGIKPVLTFIVAVFIARIKLGFLIVKAVISAVIKGIVGYVSGLLTILDGIITFISGIFTGNWKKAWEGVKTIFKGVFESFSALAKTPINAVIALINLAISGLNKLGLKIPDWVPEIGGKSFSLNIPTIPMLAKGTKSWQGGTAMIHDRGAEIVDLPRGSRVYPHDKSLQMARSEGAKGKSNIAISIAKLADKIEVRSDKDIDDIVNKVADKFERILNNTGEVVPA